MATKGDRRGRHSSSAHSPRMLIFPQPFVSWKGRRTYSIPSLKEYEKSISKSIESRQCWIQAVGNSVARREDDVNKEIRLVNPRQMRNSDVSLQHHAPSSSQDSNKELKLSNSVSLINLKFEFQSTLPRENSVSDSARFAYHELVDANDRSGAMSIASDVSDNTTELSRVSTRASWHSGYTSGTISPHVLLGSPTTALSPTSRFKDEKLFSKVGQPNGRLKEPILRALSVQSSSPNASRQTSPRSRRRAQGSETRPGKARVVRKSPAWRSLTYRHYEGNRSYKSQCPNYCRCCFTGQYDKDKWHTFKLDEDKV